MRSSQGVKDHDEPCPHYVPQVACVNFEGVIKIQFFYFLPSYFMMKRKIQFILGQRVKNQGQLSVWHSFSSAQTYDITSDTDSTTGISFSNEKNKIGIFYHAPSKKDSGGIFRYCFAHVGWSVLLVSLNLVQLITQEHFASEASNLVGN